MILERGVGSFQDLAQSDSLNVFWVDLINQHNSQKSIDISIQRLSFYIILRNTIRWHVDSNKSQ